MIDIIIAIVWFLIGVTVGLILADWQPQMVNKVLLSIGAICIAFVITACFWMWLALC